MYNILRETMQSSLNTVKSDRVSVNDHTKKFSMDAIDFQIGTEFPDALTRLVEIKRGGQLDKDFISDVTDTIKKYTGLTIDLVLIDQANAWVYPPQLKNNHVLINDLSSKYYDVEVDAKQQLKRDKLKVLTGEIDLRKGKVNGAFSDLLIPMGIGKPLLNKGSIYTAKEAVAILCHEVGHIMAYFELTSRVTRTNYIIADATNQLLNASTDKVRVKIYKDTAKRFGNTEIDDKSLGGKLDSNGYTTILLGMEAQVAEDALGSNPYNARGFEQLADVYVSRIGYGAPLAIGLDKLYKGSGQGNKIALFIAVFEKIALLSPIFYVAVVLGLLLGYSPEGNKGYDDYKQRLDRLANEIANKMKDRTLSSATRAQAVIDYKGIKEISSRVKSYTPVYDMVMLLLSSRIRKERNLVRLQEDLDRMINNPLYVLSAELRNNGE